MPVHEFHRTLIDILLGPGMGDKYSWVDKVMDCTAGLHPGKDHRGDFVHNPAFIQILSPADPVAKAVADIHMAVDPLMTNAESDAILNIAKNVAAIRAGRPDLIMNRFERKRKDRMQRARQKFANYDQSRKYMFRNY